MFFIIPTIFSSTNCCKQMKTDSEEYYSQICQTIVFQIWFCHIENHTCSNCENGSFLSNNILFQSHLQRIAPSFLNLSPLFLFHILKNKLCHFSHKTQLHYLFFFYWNFAIFNIDNTILKKILVFALHNASTAHKNLKDSFKQTVTSITTSIFFIKNSLIFTFPAYSTAW